MIRAIVAALVVLTAEMTSQKPATPVGGNASLSGTVVDDLGKLVQGARVSISREGPPYGLTFPRIESDSHGGFRFEGLPAGSYRLSAGKPGYLDAAYGRRRLVGESMSLTLSADRERTGIILELSRAAAIGGRVFDDLHRPAAGIQIQAMRRTTVNGRVRHSWGGGATSDDRGEYQIRQLPAGEYVVVVPAPAYNRVVGTRAQSPSRVSAGAPLPEYREAPNLSYLMDDDGRTMMMTSGAPLPPTASDGRRQAYVTTVHGGASRPGAASPIVVRPGERRDGVDLQLNVAPAARVSGTIVGPGGPVRSAMLRLIPAGFEDASHISDITASARPDGTFAFLRVPAGRYTIEAEVRSPPLTDVSIDDAGSARMAMDDVVDADREQYWLRQPLEVGDSDIADLALVFRTGVQVRVSVVFEGAATPPPSSGRASVRLETLDDAFRGAFLESKGAGTFAGRAKPGRYVLRVAPAGSWHFKTALMRSQAIGDGPIDVGDGDLEIQVLYTDRPAAVSGTVVDDKGQPADWASVLLFPVDRELWTDLGQFPWRARSMRVKSDGTFNIQAVAPRDYFVVAVDDAALVDWSAPAFLESMTRGAERVSMGDGEQRQVALRIVRTVTK